MSSSAQISAISAIASTSSSGLSADHGLITFPAPQSSEPPAVTFFTRSTTDRPSRRSVKRRPPTPGRAQSVAAFKKVSKAQLAANRLPEPLPEHTVSSLPPVIPQLAFRLARDSLSGGATLGVAFSAASEPLLPPLPSHQVAIDERPDAQGQKRPVPSRLNLSTISNHAAPSSSTLPEIASASHAEPSKQGAVSISSHQLPAHNLGSSSQAPSLSLKETSQPPSTIDTTEGNLKEADSIHRRSTLEDANFDRRSTATSALDSPSTKAMLERLLAAPDYFDMADGKAGSDDESDSSGSIKFLRNDGTVQGEDTETKDDIPQRVREQRERSKVKKLLGADQGVTVDDFSRPRRVDGFWSDPDFTNEVAYRKKVKGSARIDCSRSPFAQRKGSGPMYLGEDELCSPRDPGYWSSHSALPSPSSYQRPNDDYQSIRERDRLLSPVDASRRPSVDSRNQSALDVNQRSTPSSPRSTSSRVRVHAFDSLMPATVLRRSNTVSGALHTLPSTPEAYVVPPRSSSQHALSKHPKHPPRSPHPNDSAAASRASSPENPAKPSKPARIRLTKSSKSLSMPKSDPPPYYPTPAGIVVEEYKRQILDAKNVGQDSAKERRRLSALQWMIEHTKSKTKNTGSTTLAPESPPSSHHSMSPRLAKRSFSRERGYTAASPGTSEHYLSPGRGTSTYPLPSPLSGASGSNSSLPSADPKSRLHTLRSPHLYPPSPSGGSAVVQAESPSQKSVYTLPGSPRSDTLNLDEKAFAYGAIGGHIAYIPPRALSPQLEKRKVEKEKSGFSLSLGRKLSKKKLDKRSKKKDVDSDSPLSSMDGTNRGRGRSEGTYGGGADSAGIKRTRRGHSLEKQPTLEHRKSLRLSIDKFAEDGKRAAPHSSQRTLANSSSYHRSTSSPGHSVSQLPSSNTKTEPKRDDAGGKRFWKLVKRMGSNGMLKEKYLQNATSTPAIPKNEGIVGGAGFEATHGGTGRASSSRRTSLERSASGAAFIRGTPARMVPSPGLKHASSSVDGHNSCYSHSRTHQAIDTRASTPASSDHASSTKLFHRTHSTRSSTSSSADIPPPLPHPPSAFLGQRTVSNRSDGGHYSDSGYRTPLVRPPKALHTAMSDQSGQQLTDEDWKTDSAPYTPPSLPAPPRRLKPSLTTDLDEFPLFDPKSIDPADTDGSPLIPTFSVDNAINTFKPRKAARESLRQADHAAVDHAETVVFPDVLNFSSTSQPNPVPPPRPQRDARRPTAAFSPKIGREVELDSGNGVAGTTNKLKKSVKRGDEYGSKPPTSAFGPSPGFRKASPPPNVPDVAHHHHQGHRRSDSQSQPSSPRDDVALDHQKDSSPRALTEKEKAARWDALLEKSAMAGGTLHLKIGSGDRLDSDQLTLASTIVPEG